MGNTEVTRGANTQGGVAAISTTKIEVKLENGTKEAVELPAVKIAQSGTPQQVASPNVFISAQARGKENLGIDNNKDNLNQQGSSQEIEIKHNMNEYYGKVKIKVFELMNRGEFAAAAQLLETSAIVLFDTLFSKEAGMLKDNELPEAIRADYMRVSGNLNTLSLAARAVAYTYLSEEGLWTQQTPQNTPLGIFMSLPQEKMLEVLGNDLYSSIASYLQSYENALNSGKMFYSVDCSSSLKEGFAAAENGLEMLRGDIEKARGCTDSELGEIAAKWGFSGNQSRFSVMSQLVAQYVTCAENYSSAVILDLAENGGFEQYLAKQAIYQNSSPEEKEQFLWYYRVIAEDTEVAIILKKGEMAKLVTGNAKENSSLSASIGINDNVGWVNETDLFSSSNSMFALTECLSLVIPALDEHLGKQNDAKTVNIDLKENFIAYNALLLRNLNRLGAFSEAFPGMDVSSQTSGLCKNAYETTVVEGDEFLKMERNAWTYSECAKQFDENLSKQYSNILLSISSRAAMQGIKEGDLSAIGDFAKIWGKSGLILTSIAVSRCGPYGKIAGAVMNVGLAGWEFADDNYEMGGLLLLGMFGGKIPAIGPALQGTAMATMIVMGANSAIGAIKDGVNYGFTPETIAMTTEACLIGLLLPAYHGYAGVKSMFAAGMESRDVVSLGLFPTFVQKMFNASSPNQEPVRFGRYYDKTIGDLAVSRDHGIAVLEKGIWKYTDTSKYGSKIQRNDGMQVDIKNGQSYYLKDGDILIIGNKDVYRVEANRFVKIPVVEAKVQQNNLISEDPINLINEVPYLCLSERYGNRVKVTPPSGLVEYGYNKSNKLGPKVHITLPTFTEGKHFALSVKIFEDLMAITDRTGPGMAFKFMTGSNWRMYGTQFGKDFTLYFSSMDAYSKALPYLKEIGLKLNQRADFGQFNRFYERDGLKPAENVNISSELPVFVDNPWITMGIRNHRDGTFRVRRSDLQKIVANTRSLDKRALQNAPLDESGNYFVFTGDWMRNNCDYALNLILFKAYSQGCAFSD